MTSYKSTSWEKELRKNICTNFGRGFRVNSETSFNEEHTRRICVKLFLEKEISRDKDISKGARLPWKYGPKTFPTYGM